MTKSEILSLANSVAEIVLARLEPKSDECNWKEACKILGCSRRKLGQVVSENPSAKITSRTYSRTWLKKIKDAHDL